MSLRCPTVLVALDDGDALDGVTRHAPTTVGHDLVRPARREPGA